MTKILVVEDIEMNRDMLSRRLQKKGFEVIIAIDGEQGINLAKTDQPDIILMDLSLPVIDGWESSSRLKKDPTTRNIPIIALSAHALEGDRQIAIDAGCDDYDTKPVDLPRLLTKIESLIKK